MASNGSSREVPDETHVDPERGLFIPPALREFDRQIVLRTPRGTIQHFQSGGGRLDGYYGLIGAKDFGAPEDLRNPKNPRLAPDRVSIKPEGEPAVEMTVDLDPDLVPDGGTCGGDGERSTVMRHVVREPSDGTAGFGVAHVRNPPPHETEYRVEQLWPDGRAEPVYVGDSDDALELISALTEAIRNE